MMISKKFDPPSPLRARRGAANLLGQGSTQPIEKARFAEGKGLDFPSPKLGFSFPKAWIFLPPAWIFLPRFTQKENSAAPRNSMNNKVNSNCVNAVGSKWRIAADLRRQSVRPLKRRLASARPRPYMDQALLEECGDARGGTIRPVAAERPR